MFRKKSIDRTVKKHGLSIVPKQAIIEDSEDINAWLKLITIIIMFVSIYVYISALMIEPSFISLSNQSTYESDNKQSLTPTPVSYSVIAQKFLEKFSPADCQAETTSVKVAPVFIGSYTTSKGCDKEKVRRIVSLMEKSTSHQ